MIRLFVAIRPPSSVRSALRATMGGIEGARWQNDDQLHITLRFIGEVEEHRAVDIDAALSALRFPAFDIGIDGVGSFASKGKPVAVWGKIAPRGAISMLAAKIDRACQGAGLPPWAQTYLPHLTLGRLNRSAGPIDGFMTHQAGLSVPDFCVDQFALYESTLGQEGASYTMLSRYKLDLPPGD